MTGPADSSHVHSMGIIIAEDDTGWSASLEFTGDVLGSFAGTLRSLSDESAAAAVATSVATAARLRIAWVEPTIRCEADGNGLAGTDGHELANGLAEALGWPLAYPGGRSAATSLPADEPPMTVVVYSIVIEPQDEGSWHGRVGLHQLGRGRVGVARTTSSGPPTTAVDALKAAMDHMEVGWRSPEVLLPGDGEDYEPPLDEIRREEANRQSLRLGWTLPYPPLPAESRTVS